MSPVTAPCLCFCRERSVRLLSGLFYAHLVYSIRLHCFFCLRMSPVFDSGTRCCAKRSALSKR